MLTNIAAILLIIVGLRMIYTSRDDNFFWCLGVYVLFSLVALLLVGA